MLTIAECGLLRRNLEEIQKTWGKGNLPSVKVAEQYASCSFCLEEQILEVWICNDSEGMIMLWLDNPGALSD